ncbi:hypothetical protein KIH27_08950 [Mycobacterium sp. M1]|uniref:Uncharacterized protein n=1 Tax=Mycolicibacter acidiphilus TaxID=2835306 RepID=A0ABS5RI67_9MYCO|nr:hypothetical protein [Mycolicibacter acidiphilus]MBS9533712.1 hypothetical protein [Mycolicibacter acidiphilus]
MTAAHSGPRALTVFVVPTGSTDEIVGVLVDYSAAGLLDGFVWVAAADVSGPATPATLVRDGVSEPVVLQQLLTGERYERIRVAVLVPAEAPIAERVPLAAEQAVEQVARSSSVGARVTLLRLLLTSGGSLPSNAAGAVVIEGWHNLLVAPEDSSGPGLGTVAWGQLDEPLDLAQRAAPVVAAVAGLWAGVNQTPFDSLEVLPGQTVRAVRGFYRSMETTDVERQLRTRLFDPSGRMPLPRGGQIPVVYVEDVPGAAQMMARALWTKHRDVLRGPRLGATETAPQSISIWAALTMFLRFMAGALRNAPSAWLSAVKGSVTSVLASTVQGTVFGGKESAFSVVTESSTSDWQGLGRNAEKLSAAIGADPGAGHLTQQDLSPLWTDFLNGALTLADGGRRANGLEPIQVGSGIGVVADAVDVVPSSTDSFTAIPTSLAAVIGVTAVEPVDVLAVGDLGERLQRAYSDPAAGVEARGAATELERWQQRASKSYAWQVASVLTDFLGRARNEVGQLGEQLRVASAELGIDERLRARQKAVGIILATLTWATLGVLIFFAVLGATGVFGWRYALTTGGVLLGLYILVSLGLFLFTQRDLFTVLNLRKSQEEQLNMLQANLRNALQDVSRLSTAYGQLQSWCRAVGPVLRAPFGPAPAGGTVAAQIVDGLPRCALVGVAAPGAEHAANAAHDLQRHLYGLGWLTQPWQNMVQSAAEQLREDPEMLYRMPGIGTGSGLDAWSSAVSSGQVQPTGAEALWARIEQMFAGNDAVGRALTESVLVPTLGRDVAAAQFGAGFLDHQRAQAVPFDTATFTDSAITGGRSAVAIDAPLIARAGLGYRAVVVQASDGVPPYDFTLFSAAPTELTGGFEAGPPAWDNSDDGPGAPPAGDLVF